ncbi:helix-turn-helix domain-containing protein [Patescibacteria group bacterium]|nr:helix-turn-helix domain-containing protein [Patescibacteria group bacterium]
MEKNNPYLTTKEVAKLFNVTSITIYRWEKKGFIKSHRLNPKGKKFFIREEILKLIDTDNDKSSVSNDIKLLDNCNSQEVGTKAKNIKIIKKKAGCLIPKTLIINTSVFNQLLADNKILDPLGYKWSNFKIPTKYQKIILEKISQEFNNKPLVVRSSATCEDSPLLSFAGQYSSFLNIKGEKNISRAIKLCYQSLFSDNAKIYAKINGIRLEYESMAIAVQELAPVTVAGVIFTADPVNQNAKKMIVEYTEGLGDSIVSGHKKPNTVEIDKKKINNLQNIFLRKLSKIALNLEKVFGNPQDIEWGWDGKKIYIFQSRNITTLDKHPKTINYTFSKNKILGTGVIVCRGVASGFLKIIDNTEDYDKIKDGDVVLVNCKIDNTLIKKIPLINALIINGGILSHIAVIAREFNIPCLTEPEISNKKFKKYLNKKIIVDAIRGKILLT